MASGHPSTRRVGDVDRVEDLGDLQTHAALLEAGVAEVTVVDGVPTVVVDELFEAARQQALAGFDDIDRARARQTHPSNPQR